MTRKPFTVATLLALASSIAAAEPKDSIALRAMTFRSSRAQWKFASRLKNVKSKKTCENISSLTPTISRVDSARVVIKNSSFNVSAIVELIRAFQWPENEKSLKLKFSSFRIFFLSIYRKSFNEMSCSTRN